jgi:Flp pilus assembly protein TadG
MASLYARALAEQFNRDERGTIAMMFGLMIAMAVGCVGLAVDYSRILLARNALNDAADAAGLATGRAMIDGSVTVDEAKTIGAIYFSENAKSLTKAGAAIPIPVITPDPDTSTVMVTAQASVPTPFAAFFGFKTMIVPTASKVSFDAKDLEVGMSLDITGSMSWPASSTDMTSKIDGLKSAFEKFATTLIPENQQVGRKVRLGIMPYAPSVNLGKYAAAASQNKSKDGCIVERTTLAYNDLSPANGGAFHANPSQYCPSATVMPLTDDRDALIKHVKTFQPNGATAGHLGIQWAWNIIAEDYAGFWGGSASPSAYALTQGAKPKLVKAVIVMTDGQFNTSTFGASSETQARAMCTAIKKRGVLVFTVGFGLGTTATELQAKKLLQDCATPGPQYFADATNANQLDAALQSFAATLGKLRVSQ